MPAALHHAYALSPLQQGMLTHHTGAAGAGVDLVQIVMHLRGPLPAAAFAQGWRWLAQRHDILRTSFDAGSEGHPPLQKVHAEPQVEFTWHDWSEQSSAGRAEAWHRLLAADRARGLDPAVTPLWRVSVVQDATDEHRVLFTFHHLLLDARAVLVLFPELFDATAAFATGAAPATPAPQPYRAYIDWLQQQDFTASLAYWQKALAGFRTPTPLPLAGAARLDPLAAPGSHARTLRLDPAQTTVLKNFARDHAITLNTLVQGAWALLLARYSGEAEVVFGAVRACRHGSVAGADRLVGPLINTVPLRVALPEGVRTAAWLRDLRRQWIEIRPHEQVALTAIRPLTEIPAGTRMFETVVSYQEPSWDDALVARGGPWANRRFEVHNHTGFPLALDAAGGDHLQLCLTYDPARHGAAAIERMLGHLATLIQGMADFPDRFLANLPLLTPAEENALLRGWRAAPVDFGPLECVPALFSRQARQQPTALAVSDPQRSLRYDELDQASSALATRLRAQGVKPNVLVGVCVTPSVDLVVALLAVLKSGGAYVPMDPAYPAERLAFMAGDAGLRLVVTERRHAALFATTSVRPLCVDDTDATTPATPIPAVAATLDDPAYLIYTSGSTGQPKGVSLRHRNLANLVAWHRQAYAVTPADRATQLASPAFDACTWELWPYLAAGASIHIPAAEVRVSPDRLVRWLAAERITLSFIPTPLAEATLDEAWPADTTLRAILTGGDRLRRWPGSRLPCPLFNHYGPTEGTVVATRAQVPAEPDGSPAPAIGRPIANHEIYVLDAHRQLVPIGVPGELYLGGAGLADGYHERPDLTEAKFVDHPFALLSERKLYRTGDLVRWREDGQLDYLGRIDQQVKIRGHRIEPGEIEAVLNEHPAVRESLVIARDDAAHQPQLVAYYLPRPGHDAPASAAFAAALHRRLPAYMVPAAFVALEAWPLTAHGKIDRTRLPAPTPASASTPAGTAPRPGLESTIAAIWSEVLGCTCASTTDDFFALGGHSLRAAQVVARLNDALQLPLTVRHLFEHSTIAGLATVITQARASAPAPAPFPQPSELVSSSLA
jgi:amino acid adenylation domain-containing protein